ncbi:MAG: class I SAM-dependent methyltransferase [Candidatus Wukongarchaeota archaeon]|nr:class I SAM-dependent methyltransferase [Candidatus Wukongarchaeota archaeon]
MSKEMLSFWDRRAERFENFTDKRIKGIRKLVGKIAPFVKSFESGVVVDLGCGPAVPGEILESVLGSPIIGLDFSIPMLGIAKTRLRSLIRGDVFNLPFKGGSIAVIFCINVLSDYAEKTRAYRQIYDCLKKGGAFFYADYSENDEFWDMNSKIYPLVFGMKPSVSREPLPKMKKDLEKIGFKIVSKHLISFKMKITLEEYINHLSTRPQSNFRKEKREVVEKIAQTYISKNNEIGREFFLIHAQKLE